MNPITQDLYRFVVDNFLFGQADGRLSDETSFLEAGIIDSTGVLELIAFLGERFGIQILDEEIVPENLDSLRRLTCFVERKLAAKPVEAQACR